MADRNIPGGDASFASVVSLLHFDGANASTTIADQIGKTWTAQGDAQLSTTSPKFGTASLLLDGTGDWVQTSGTTDYVFGPGDFTVEAWIKTSTLREQLIVDFYVPLQVSWQLELNSAGRLNFYGSNGSTNGAIATGTSVLTNGAWHHVAVCRSGSTVKLFVDGTQEASVTDSRSFTYQTSLLAVGAQVTTRNAAYDFPGNIDDVRITKGVGRYTANFTAPVSPFPDAGTVVLAQTLAGVSQTSTVSIAFRASGAQVLDGVAQSAAVRVRALAAASQTLGGVVQSAAGTTGNVDRSFTAAQVLAGVGQSAAVGAGVMGGAAQTLAGVAQSATVVVITPARFAAAQTLESALQAGTAVAIANASAAQSLDGVISTASAVVQVAFQGAQQLAGLVQDANGASNINAGAAQALAGVSQVATAAVAETVRAFVAAQVLAAVTQSARIRHEYTFERNERTRDVRAEKRGFLVAGELRAFDVQAESRMANLAGERRRIAFTD